MSDFFLTLVQPLVAKEVFLNLPYEKVLQIGRVEPRLQTEVDYYVRQLKYADSGTLVRRSCDSLLTFHY